MDEWRVGSVNKSLPGKLLSSSEYTDISYRREKCFLGFAFDTGKPGGNKQQKENPASGVTLCHAAHTTSMVIIALSFQKPALS